MLEKLASVPWEKFKHAYGAATDVPQLIRDLDDPARREKALDRLNITIYHQGTIYEATVHAVPFLLEVLQQGKHADRAGLLVLLRRLFGGTSYHEVHQGGVLGPRLPKNELEAQIALERSWSAAVKQGIAAGEALYTRLLADADAPTALAAAYLLLHFADHISLAAGLFERIVFTTSEVVRAGFVYCVGICAAKDTDLQELLRDLYCAGDEPLALRAAAAIFVIRYHPEKPMPQAVAALTAALDGNGVPEIFDQFPWPDNDFAGHAVCSLAFLKDDARPLLPRMAQALRKTPHADAARNMVDAILFVALNGKPFPKDGAYAACTDEQKLVFSAMGDSNGFWGPEGVVNIDVFPLLRKLNLPRNRKNFRAFLAGRLKPTDPAWTEEYSLEGVTISTTGPDGRTVRATLDIKIGGKAKPTT